MKHVKDRIKDGLMLIIVMVGVMIASMTLTACSDEEEEMEKLSPESYICTIQQSDSIFTEISGVIKYDEVIEQYVVSIEYADWKSVSVLCPLDTSLSVALYPINDSECLKDVGIGETISIYIETVILTHVDEKAPTWYFGYNSGNERIVSRSTAQNNGIGCYLPSNLNYIPTPYFDEVVSRATTLQYLSLYIHFVGEPSEYSYSRSFKEIANSIKVQLNNHYYKSGFQFELRGVDNFAYNLNSFTLTDETKVRDLASHNYNAKGINIYILPVPTLDGVAARVVDIPSQALIAHQYLKSNVMAHEVGHCLGLYHTHKGTDPNERGPEDKPEYVDGSNGDNAGDRIKDTPADPNQWNSDGSYAGGDITDAHGDKYNPDPYNFMCYSGIGANFTSLQVQRMKAIVNTTLKNIIYDGQPQIVGNIHFNTNQIFNDSSNEYDVTTEWIVRRHSLQTSSEDIPEIVAEEYFTGTSINIESKKSEYFEIIAYYSNISAPQTQTWFYATSGAPSPVTGTLWWQYCGQEGFTKNMDHGQPLSIFTDGETMTLNYIDRANARLSGLDYRVVTAANRVLSGKTMTVNKADCSQGFLKVRTYDDCGASDGYFTIPVTVYGAYYGVNVADGSVTFDSRMGATPTGGKQMAPAAKRSIGSVVVYDASGNEVKRMEASDGRMSAEVNTTGWPKGEYKAVVSDGNGYTQEIPFAI